MISLIGFAYSLAQQTITVNYLGTQFELSPSDIKLSLSIADWQWAEGYLGAASSLQLVLRTTLMVYADTPFTSLSSEYDAASQQTIYKITSQVCLNILCLVPPLNPFFYRMLRWQLDSLIGRRQISRSRTWPYHQSFRQRALHSIWIYPTFSPT